MKKITLIILSVSVFILSSCGEKDSKNYNLESKTNSGVVITETKILKKNNEVKYNDKKEELTIGEIVIHSGLPSNFPKEIEIYDDSKTYVNSNVENYIYFVTDKNTEINTIGKYYINLFNKLGYIRKIDKNKDLNQKELNNLEFYTKNLNYIPKVKRTDAIIMELAKSKEIIDIENEYEKNVKIYINKETPENIKKGMGLEGVFVEIYY